LIMGNSPGGRALWHWLEMGFSFLMLTLFFAVMYQILSAGQIAWRYILYGAVVSSLLFTLGKALISLYLAYTSMASIYGAAGSLVLFLVWVYYSSQIVFFGAELVQARRTRNEWLNGSAS
jgi:membrane protein